VLFWNILSGNNRQIYTFHTQYTSRANAGQFELLTGVVSMYSFDCNDRHLSTGLSCRASRAQRDHRASRANRVQMAPQVFLEPWGHRVCEGWRVTR